MITIFSVFIIEKERFLGRPRLRLPSQRWLYMRKYKLVLLIGGYISAFIIGGYTYGIVTKAQMVNAGDVLTEESREKFQSMTKEMEENFKPDNYEELLKGNDNILTVPDTILGPQQEDITKSIFGRQKNYIYKNKTNGTIVLLSISSRLGSQHQQWQHSIYYSNARYNSLDNELKEYYSDIYPSINVYQYSFEKKGYSISCTLFANADFDEGSNSLVDFVTQLDTFLNGSF